MLSIPWLLRRVNQRYRAATAERLAAGGFGDLPQPGIWALMAIAGGAGDPGQLTARMGVSKQAVSKLVDRLVAAGYVERRPNPSDRRRTDIALSADGRRAVQVIATAVRATERQMAAELGADSFDQLGRLLAELAGDAAP